MTNPSLWAITVNGPVSMLKLSMFNIPFEVVKLPIFLICKITRSVKRFDDSLSNMFIVRFTAIVAFVMFTSNIEFISELKLTGISQKSPSKIQSTQEQSLSRILFTWFVMSKLLFWLYSPVKLNISVEEMYALRLKGNVL